MTAKLIVLDLRTVNLTVGAAKIALYEQEKIDPKSQEWILSDQSLKDDKNLKYDYQISRESVIHLIFKKT